MKFLCVECDTAMALTGAHGPDRGSMTVVFACPACDKQTAMLTNASETQVVRSLGVKIGGHAVQAESMQAEPMEGIRTGLAGGEMRDFHDVGADGYHIPRTDGSSHGAGMGKGASKCPFTGMVNEAFERSGMPWSEAARLRIERIPLSARSIVMQGVEAYAREEGFAEVTEAVLESARSRMGM